jgi:AhpD family alkylhydroperoxidase
MAHIEPKSREELPELQKVMAMAQATMGFVPNSMLTMAHMPQLSMAFSILAGVVYGADLRAMFANYSDSVPKHSGADENLDPQLIQLIAFSVSLSSGCRYCQAHTSHKLTGTGASAEKLNELLRYEESDLFTAAEKSLIALALAAGQTPNEATQAHFDSLHLHYSDRQIVQIVAVIALFGFLNRWNDTMATTLESEPLSFALDTLSAFNWDVSKHT